MFPITNKWDIFDAVVLLRGYALSIHVSYPDVQQQSLPAFN